jgi:hypothetical protein
MLPLHLCARNYPANFAIWEELLTAHPAAVYVKDRKGRTPLQGGLCATGKEKNVALSVLDLYTQISSAGEKQRWWTEQAQQTAQSIKAVTDQHAAILQATTSDLERRMAVLQERHAVTVGALAAKLKQTTAKHAALQQELQKYQSMHNQQQQQQQQKQKQDAPATSLSSLAPTTNSRCSDADLKQENEQLKQTIQALLQQQERLVQSLEENQAREEVFMSTWQQHYQNQSASTVALKHELQLSLQKHLDGNNQNENNKNSNRHNEDDTNSDQKVVSVQKKQQQQQQESSQQHHVDSSSESDGNDDENKVESKGRDKSSNPPHVAQQEDSTDAVVSLPSVPPMEEETPNKVNEGGADATHAASVVERSTIGGDDKHEETVAAVPHTVHENDDIIISAPSVEVATENGKDTVVVVTPLADAEHNIIKEDTAAEPAAAAAVNVDKTTTFMDMDMDDELKIIVDKRDDGDDKDEKVTTTTMTSLTGDDIVVTAAVTTATVETAIVNANSKEEREQQEGHHHVTCLQKLDVEEDIKNVIEMLPSSHSRSQEDNAAAEEKKQEEEDLNDNNDNVGVSTMEKEKEEAPDMKTPLVAAIITAEKAAQEAVVKTEEYGATRFEITDTIDEKEHATATPSDDHDEEVEEVVEVAGALSPKAPFDEPQEQGFERPLSVVNVSCSTTVEEEDEEGEDEGVEQELSSNTNDELDRSYDNVEEQEVNAFEQTLTSPDPTMEEHDDVFRTTTDGSGIGASSNAENEEVPLSEIVGGGGAKTTDATRPPAIQTTPFLTTTPPPSTSPVSPQLLAKASAERKSPAAALVGVPSDENDEGNIDRRPIEKLQLN